MLGWRDFTKRQRVGAVFLVVVGLFGTPFMLFDAASAGELIFKVGGTLAALGALLNPQSFGQPSGSTISLASMPKACRALTIAGSMFVVVGAIWWYAQLGRM